MIMASLLSRTININSIIRLPIPNRSMFRLLIMAMIRLICLRNTSECR